MISKVRWLGSRRASAAAAVLSVAWFAGCASVAHVGLYRDARQDFSEAAAADNLAVLGTLLPDPAAVKSGGEGLGGQVGKDKALASAQTAEESFDRWNNVANLFVALNRRFAKELGQDELYGSSRVLELVARSQRALYGHELNATSDGAAPSDAIPLEPLSAPVAEAEALSNDKSVKLFARDAYLLRALKAETSYKIAYLRAIRASAEGKLDLDKICETAEKMAAAEEELAKAATGAGEAIERQAAMSRLVMLLSARFLVTGAQTGNQPLPASPELAPKLRQLHARVDHYRQQVGDDKTIEFRLFQRMVGRKPGPSDFALVGLGRIAP